MQGPPDDGNHVVFPLMPHGVVRALYDGLTRSDIAVVFPLMPQGVEHVDGVFVKEVQNDCGFSVDAARR